MLKILTKQPNWKKYQESKTYERNNRTEEITKSAWDSDDLIELQENQGVSEIIVKQSN